MTTETQTKPRTKITPDRSKFSKPLQPFCVSTEIFSKEQILDIIDLMIEAGAGTWDVSLEHQGLYSYNNNSFSWNTYKFWGYRVSYGIYTWSDPNSFNGPILESMQEVYGHLGYNQKEQLTVKTNNKSNTKQQQFKSSTKGQKILPKTSNLLKFVYTESTYIVRGVTSYEVEHEPSTGKLWLKYDFKRKHQNGETSGTNKIQILSDLEQVLFLSPSAKFPEHYQQDIILNLVG